MSEQKALASKLAQALKSLTSVISPDGLLGPSLQLIVDVHNTLIQEPPKVIEEPTTEA